MNITPENQKMLSTGALILSVVILIAALGLALWPLSSTAATIQSLKKKSFAAQLAGKKAKESSKAQLDVAIAQTWSGSGNEIGPTAYANLNAIATGLNVKILGFRAQRLTNAGDVSQLPYVVNAVGRYTDVLQFVHKIETTPSKLAVELFQLGAADETTDQVTATIGLEAYVLNATATTNSPGSTTKTTTTKVTTSTKPTITIRTKELAHGIQSK